MRDKRNDESQSEYLINLIREDERGKVKYRIARTLQGMDDAVVDRVIRAVGASD